MIGENILSGTELLPASCAIVAELFPPLGCFPGRKLEINRVWFCFSRLPGRKNYIKYVCKYKQRNRVTQSIHI